MIEGPRPERCSVVHTNFHRATISHSVTLFSNDEVSPTRSATFGLASAQVAVPTAAPATLLEPN